MENDDGDSYDSFVNKNYKKVYRHFQRKCHSTQITEDLTQKTFALFQPYFGKLPCDKREPCLWKIANSAWCDHCKKSTRHIDSEKLRRHLNKEQLNVLESLALKEMKTKLRQAVRCLPKDLRQLVILRDYAGWSYEEIANKLGKKQSTLRANHVRALEMLRKSLDK